MSSKEGIGYLFVNGLNDGRTKLQDRIASSWWRKRGISLTHAHVDWFGGSSVVEEVRSLEATAYDLLQENRGVVLLGNSAGGSLALNAFARMSDKRIVLVTAHARLAEGDYVDTHPQSLYRRAKKHTSQPSPLFVESVRAAQLAASIMPTEKKERALTMSSLTDNVVPPALMSVVGIHNHESRAHSHIGGWLTHMIVERDLIINFAEAQFPQTS